MYKKLFCLISFLLLLPALDNITQAQETASVTVEKPISVYYE